MSADGPAIDTEQLRMGDRELEALRRHGFGVAYRMLGSVSEAEDVAQEALLRLTRQEGPIEEPTAWTDSPLVESIPGPGLVKGDGHRSHHPAA